MVSKDYLIAFEKEIGDLFNEGKIKAPVHLYWVMKIMLLMFLKILI